MRHLSLSVLCCAICILGACRTNSDQRSEENLGDPDASGKGCVGATLDVTSALPLDEVLFELDGSLEQDLAVSFFWDDSRRSFPGLVLLPSQNGEDAEERLSFKVPPHPDGIEGGSLRVQFSGDDGLICPAAALEVLPIEAAPGARARFIGAAQRLLDADAALMGLTRAELVEAHRIEDLNEFRSQIPAPAAPLVVAQYALDHPDNPASLSAILDAEDASIQESLKTFDALLEHSGIIAQFERQADTIERLSPVRYVANNPGTSAASLGEESFKVGVADPEELSQYMNLSIDSCGATKSFFSDSVTYASLASIDVNPVWKGFTASYALTGTVALEFQKMMCQLFPGKLENFLLEEPNVDMLEDANEFDFERRLAVASVDASSRGAWNPALSAFLMALQAKGSLGAIKGASDTQKFYAAVNQSASVSSWYKVQKAVVQSVDDAIANGVDYGKGKGAEALDKYTEMGDVGPYQWKNIDIRDNRYIMLLSETGIFREFICGAQRFCFVPVRTGEEQLGFMPDIQKFPTEDLPRVNGVGLVRPVTIKLDPEIRHSVKLGEELVITYEVEADDLTVEWENTSSFEDPRDAITNSSITDAEKGQMVFRAPTDPDEFPVVIRATSLSTTGLLDNPYVPTPMSFLVLELDDEFRVEQDEDCVAPGQSVQLTPIYNEEAHPRARIVWETTGGEVDGDSVWVAPSRRQVHTIKATLIAEDGIELEDEVQIIVGECECWYSVSVAGPDIGLDHAQEFGTMIARDRGDALDPLPGYGLYFHMGTSLTAPGIFSIFLDDAFVEHAPAKTLASELSLPPSYLYSPGTTEQWVADGEKSWLELSSSEPYGDTKYVQGEGFSVHPYKDGQGRVKNFVVRFRFKTILEHPACMNKASHDGWKAINGY